MDWDNEIRNGQGFGDEATETYLTTVNDDMEFIIVEAKLKQAGIPVIKKQMDIGYFDRAYFGMSAMPVDIYVPSGTLKIAKALIVQDDPKSVPDEAGVGALFDSHCHTLFSCDGHDSAEDCVFDAMSKGLSHICFTDHIDMNPKDEGYGFYDYDAYSHEIEMLREKYASNITILKGIEFGEPHIYGDAFKKETDTERDYDVIIGALHWLDDLFCGNRELLERYGHQQLMLNYYNSLYEMVNYGGFDVLAHFDFPNRYFGMIPPGTDPLIDEAVYKVIEASVSKGITLEINTSGYRRGYQHTMPALDILNLYAQCGGTNVTIGSDAHRKGDICAHYDEASGNAESAGLLKGVFVKRAFTLI